MNRSQFAAKVYALQAAKPWYTIEEAIQEIAREITDDQ